MWVNGPFPPGEWPDVNIALSSLVCMFEGDERAVADKGHRGHLRFFDTPWRCLDNQFQKDRKALARARHETINRRFKCWQILKQVCRHSLAKQGEVFRAVANIENTVLKVEGTWQIECNDYF